MKDYMQEALDLAKLGQGWTRSNPMVGAVIVKNSQIIGRGYHQQYGCLHAEREALKDASEQGHDVKGATMYVTLEPCCHFGKTPPCTHALIEAGIEKVVVAVTDPNPLVAGKGIQELRNHHIEVETGLLAKESEDLNRKFNYFMTHQRPYVTMKYAMTLDGRTAAYTGDSQWITDKIAREHVHYQRHSNQAIMVGIGTALADDPSLTVRIDDFEGINPIRIVCDTSLKLPLTSQLVKTAKETPTIIATTNQNPQDQQVYQEAGCQLLVVNAKNDKVDLVDLITHLGQQGIQSIYVEGGSRLNASLLEAGLIQEIHTYIGPKVIGGFDQYSPISGFGFPHMNQALTSYIQAITPLGQDLLIESRVG
ncbi:bifunctional diaminohydroxyphosphoribosylaminopyrimidine deaminase/5-amino-6-(5-phosphoribosylamino)uracil reductase RibD [Aerococcus urinaeequi]|uniref:Riboflavin biosynthesis protein RibD n=1 Tax=Aerococcus urinaeequi TaxID=51665 RepID=A0AAE9XQ04_9LACT|nr:bifunctional diaminohydroxyphosphoribosylaminopyrimidine deaminase/5-amino-6-(5-phosphoribosylamino)uracil reductase RibD [Aerococcus urinaeequi]WCG38060.1 bifunctional diaminohydroxyphosphoribosylaminopyrimidine deaminase/5-amino-6-(5-phosphoribosylamino)uracil reductase RibD [Aerococcus urinaeequi]